MSDGRTLDRMLEASNDAKYLNRLNRYDFGKLLFPDSLDESYVDKKWEWFNDGIMEFMWSCSIDKLKIMADFIDECKKDEVIE